jgi:alpha-glucosidase
VVVYQIYPRSFADADGDGEGDLPGITARLDHLAWLGVDALWMSPICPSPMADGGYDVADYTDVDPRFGTLADLDALVARAHELDLKVLLDLVPCHTSIEHPWFVEHPERYVWSPVDGPPNNWRATFGGPAWSRDPHGRGWYLHSFYPEQPDLDWRNPAVPEAFAEVLGFWRARGIDGFRLDAIDRLRKDPELRDDPPRPPGGRPPLPEGDPDVAALETSRSRNAPDVGEAVAALRAGAGDDAFLVGEVYLPTAQLGPYLEHLDVAFSFDLLHAPWDAAAVRAALQAAGEHAIAWVLSNHDFPRLPGRVGAEHVRGAALLLLTLPGVAFVFQGDELGQPDGPGRPDGDPRGPDDRHGRDPHRHPLPWEPRGAGFTTGKPWLPVLDVPGLSVAEQRQDPGSMLHLVRDLIAVRRELRGPLEIVDAGQDGVLALRRGPHVVVLNLSAHDRPVPDVARGAEVRRHTHDPEIWEAPALLEPGHGFVAFTTG